MDKDQKRKQLKTYTRYSGMAAEMFGLIILMVFIGQRVDKWMENEKSYVTALLVVLGLSAYLYKIYIQLGKNDKK